GIFCNMTNSWWPILVMVIIYSLIGLVSALLMPEVKDRDLSVLEDAAEVSKIKKVRAGVTQAS
ncbi:MAG: MFS transporter, partial [Citrobacter sp.]